MPCCTRRFSFVEGIESLIRTQARVTPADAAESSSGQAAFQARASRVIYLPSPGREFGLVRAAGNVARSLATIREIEQNLAAGQSMSESLLEAPRRIDCGDRCAKLVAGN